MDPSLLTPSYEAPYRPRYSGTQPYNQYGRVGFFGGVNRLFNPFVEEPIWGNPIDEQQPSIEGISARPFDSLAWAGQRILAPALAFGGAFRLLGPRTFGGYFTGGGIASGLGRAVGSGFGRGLASAIGLRGAAAAGMGAAAGVVGSVAGGFLLPIAAAQGALWGGQKALWNPYINTRMQARDLRRNFAGASFVDAAGNPVTGGGLGFRESYEMASEITRAGIQDMAFSTSDYAAIADMSARAGLMDNVKARQITQRVKDVAEQIKLIMAISKDPDIKNAIEELSKLNLAGASVTGGQFSNAAAAYRGLGNLASQAGVSIQRLMNTVGAQGQYMFQAAGMTPYLGQMAAANVYSGFAAAQRVGLLSPAQLARMGGLEGATQSTMSAMVRAAQTPYNLMGLYNQYIGGAAGGAIPGFNQSFSDTIRQFGHSVAMDPFRVMGQMSLFGSQMAGRQLSEQGPSAIINQAVSILSQLPIARNANGKFDAETLVPILTHMMGLSPDEAMGIIMSQATMADPTTLAQRLRGADKFSAEQMRQAISQNFAYGGRIGRTVHSIKRFGRNLTEGIAESLVFPVTQLSGSLADTVQEAVEFFQFGETIGKGLRVSDVSTLFDTEPRTNEPLRLIRTGLFDGLSSTTTSVVEKINELARHGDADARAFLRATTPEERRRALTRVIGNNRDYFGEAGARVLNTDDTSAYRTFMEETERASRFVLTETEPMTARSRVLRAFRQTVGSENLGLLDTMSAVGAAYNLKQSGELSFGTIDQILEDPRYAALKKAIGDKTGADAIDAINALIRRAAEQGTIGISNDAFDLGISMESLKSSKGRLITDSKLRREFQKALKAGDEEAMHRIGLQYVAGLGGGRLLDDPLKVPEDLETSKVMEIIAPMIETGEQRRKLLELVKSGQVDFTSALSTINSLDQRQTTKKFEDAVSKFDAAVDRMPGAERRIGSGGSYPPLPSRVAPPWLGGPDTAKVSGARGPQ